jgi:hypothetical protein
MQHVYALLCLTIVSNACAKSHSIPQRALRQSRNSCENPVLQRMRRPAADFPRTRTGICVYLRPSAVPGFVFFKELNKWNWD